MGRGFDSSRQRQLLNDTQLSREVSQRVPADSGRYPSGQRGQTVNLLAYAFGGSNPPLPTTLPGAMSPEQTEGGLKQAQLREARAAMRCVLSPLREARALPALENRLTRAEKRQDSEQCATLFSGVHAR